MPGSNFPFHQIYRAPKHLHATLKMGNSSHFVRTLSLHICANSFSKASKCAHLPSTPKIVLNKIDSMVCCFPYLQTYRTPKITHRGERGSFFRLHGLLICITLERVFPRPPKLLIWLVYTSKIGLNKSGCKVYLSYLQG